MRWDSRSHAGEPCGKRSSVGTSDLSGSCTGPDRSPASRIGRSRHRLSSTAHCSTRAVSAIDSWTSRLAASYCDVQPNVVEVSTLLMPMRRFKRPGSAMVQPKSGGSAGVLASFSSISVIVPSVSSKVPATDTAFSYATLTTLAGSMMPTSTRSTYSQTLASKPRSPLLDALQHLVRKEDGVVRVLVEPRHR